MTSIASRHSSSSDENGGKRRTYYRITDEGRQYYRDKCAEWQLTKDVIENFIRNDI